MSDILVRHLSGLSSIVQKSSSRLCAYLLHATQHRALECKDRCRLGRFPPHCLHPQAWFTVKVDADDPSIAVSAMQTLSTPVPGLQAKSYSRGSCLMAFEAISACAQAENQLHDSVLVKSPTPHNEFTIKQERTCMKKSKALCCMPSSLSATTQCQICVSRGIQQRVALHTTRPCPLHQGIAVGYATSGISWTVSCSSKLPPLVSTGGFTTPTGSIACLRIA
jgi:hypothetical protein